MLLSAIASLLLQKGDMGIATLPLVILVPIAAIIVKDNWDESEKYVQKYQSQLNSWKLAKEQHEESLRDYDKKKLKYEEDLKGIPIMSKKELILEGLKRYFRNEVTQPKLTNFEVKKGRSEAIFYNFLRNIIGKNIKLDRTIISDYEFVDKPYIPDMIYQNEESRMCIDIEIDEKFEKENYEVIHYKNSDHDEKRNTFFVLNSWLVLRFTEDQVLNDLEGCTVTLLEIILKYDPCFSLNRFQHEFYWKHEKVETEPEWTYLEIYNGLKNNEFAL